MALAVAPPTANEMAITGMALAQSKWPSLGVSLIQFAEPHRTRDCKCCQRAKALPQSTADKLADSEFTAALD
jgi:hypothetical protein